MDASAESKTGFDRIGARSAVDFDERQFGRNGGGRGGGWVYSRVELKLSRPGGAAEWDVVDGVGGSGRDFSTDWLGGGWGGRSKDPNVDGDCGICGVPRPLVL